MMFATILLSIILVHEVRAEVVLTLTPEVIDPGFTPFFNLRCSALEQEEGNVASISILRTTTTARNANAAPQELIAELIGSELSPPRLAPGFENLTAVGQISQLEEELGTFLEVIWPDPQVQDLGLYTCEVTIFGETGGLTRFAEARVTTSNLVTDRLLAVVLALEEKVNILNKTLLELQDELENVTAVLLTAQELAAKPTEVSYPEKEEAVVDEPTVDTPTETSPEEEITTQKTQELETATEGTPTVRADEDLTRLTVAVETLETRFEQFNETLARLDKLIAALEKQDDNARNETRPEQVSVDVIRSYFVSENASYFLFQANQNTDTYRAQIVCESKRLYLAEISDEQEFQVISQEILPSIPDGSVVLVGGYKSLQDNKWIYPNSRETVSFFVWGPEEPVETRNSDCLALQKFEEGLIMVPVSCSSDQNNLYFLCERDDNN